MSATNDVNNNTVIQVDKLAPSRKHQTRTPDAAILHSCLLTAAIRRDETERTDIGDSEKLITDQYARVLAGDIQHHTKFVHRNKYATNEELMKYESDILHERTQRPEVLIRCKYIDEWITDTVYKLYKDHSDTIQILIVGCGMDTRAYRLQCMQYCTVYEIDQPVVIQYKQQKLQPYQTIANRVEHIGADVTTSDWLTRLRVSTFDIQRRTIIVLEGVTMYLREQELRRFLRQVHTVTAHNNQYIICDIVNQHCISHHTQIQYYHLFKYGASAEQIEQLLYESGYTVKYSNDSKQLLYIGYDSVSYNRYLLPPYMNAAQQSCYTYLVHAVKRTVKQKQNVQ